MEENLSKKLSRQLHWKNKSYTPWREGSDGRQIQYKNYIGPLH